MKTALTRIKRWRLSIIDGRQGLAQGLHVWISMSPQLSHCRPLSPAEHTEESRWNGWPSSRAYATDMPGSAASLSMCVAALRTVICSFSNMHTKPKNGCNCDLHSLPMHSRPQKVGKPKL